MKSEIIFASISVFLYFLGFIPYIYHVFHGRVVPHPFTWSIWFIFSVTNLYILLVTLGIEASFYTLLARTIALFIGLTIGWWFIRKIPLSQFDYLSLVLASFVIVCIYFYGLKEAVIVMVIVDIIVVLPTLKKIWIDPRSEDALVWFTAGLSQACLILSFPFLSFENSFFWFYAICANLAIGLFIRILTKQREKRLFIRIENFFFDLKEKYKRHLL